MKINFSKRHDILPTVIAEGKPAKKVEPEFFIVNVAHGRPKTSQFSIMKHADFPVENRNTPQKVSFRVGLKIIICLAC